MLKAQMTRGWGTMSVEAQYCFAYGHCDNFNVPANAAAMYHECNARFGFHWMTKPDTETEPPIYNREEGGINETDSLPPEARLAKIRENSQGNPSYSTTTMVMEATSYPFRMKE